MAFNSYLLGLYFGVLLSASSNGAEAPEVEVFQPQDNASVTVGGTLRLECRVTVARVLPGPVKWFLGEGANRKLIYAGIGKFERVMREYEGSSRDFTILIHNVSLEDAGTYYCVKQRSGHNDDTDVKSGRGTQVDVTEGSQKDYLIPLAAGAACVLLAAFLFVAVHFYTKKKRGRNCHMSRSAEPLPVNPRTPNQTLGDKELVYADLKDPSGLKRPKESVPEHHSEYATVRVPQSFPG